MSTRNKSHGHESLQNASAKNSTATNRNLPWDGESPSPMMSQQEIIQLRQVRSSTGNTIISDRIEKLQYESDLNDLITFTSESESKSTFTWTAPVRENWEWSGESRMIQGIHYFFTKETFSMAVKTFRFGSFIKSVPFELDSKNGKSLRVRPFEKKWQWALWHLVSWIIFSSIAFEYISFFFLWQRASLGKEMAFHIMYLVFSGWLLLFFLSVYLNPRGFILMINHHDEIMRNLSRLDQHQKHWASHPFVILSSCYVGWAFLLFDCVFVLFYLRHPERSQYIYSAFPASWKEDGLILYGGCALFEFFWMCCGFSLMSLCFCYWSAHIYTLNGSLNQLRGRKNMNENAIESYIFLQLFCSSFNDFHSGLYCPALCFILFLTPVLFTYMSLTTYHMLSLLVYLSFPTFTVVAIGLILFFWPQNSKVQIKSVDLIERFTHLPIGAKRVSSSLIILSHLPEGERRGYLKRRVKAFRRLRIQVSYFGAFCLNTSALTIEQVIHNVLLLLSL